MPQPTKIVLACDESGAKGYADREEAFPGEVGVIAGILVPDSIYGTVAPRFQAIWHQFQSPTGKLHITDLDGAAQGQLREEIYRAVREENLPCFWYAIHVAGLHQAHANQQKIEKNTRERQRERRAGEEPRVKMGSPRSSPMLMHTELFSGLYGNLVAFLEERQRKEVEIEIRTDRVDSPIVEEFEAIAKDLLSNNPLESKVKGFDTVTEKLVEGSIKVEAMYPPEMAVNVVVRSLAINASTATDGLVLAADVLANSLNYHFKNRTAAALYGPLNSPGAVVGHPLEKSLDAFSVDFH
jgi:hypothetical protein